MSSPVLNQSPDNGVSVLVVGAGVGGLMTALECRRRGCSVRVLERTKTSSGLGDSFGIGPSATDAFRNYPDLQRESAQIRRDPRIKFCNGRGERLHGPLDADSLLSDASVRAGRRLYRYWRPEFHAMLLRQLDALGIAVAYDHAVVEYFEDGERGVGGVVLADGVTRLEADLVVAADGARGASWPLVAGRPVPARSTGDAVYRVAFPVEHALADPEVAARFPLADDGRSTVEMWASDTWTFLAWRDTEIMSFAWQRPDPAGTAEESWGHRVAIEDVLQFAAGIDGWPEIGSRVIRTTPADAAIVDWKLMWRDPQPRCWSPAGRVVQVGDAAHTFLPTSGNGGTQAVEDGVSLAACIHAALAAPSGGKHSIPDAVRVHGLLRFERVSCLQALGVLNRQRFHEVDGKQVPIHFGKWILDHDPEQYAIDSYGQALAHLQGGAPFVNTNTPPGLEYRPWTIDGLLAAHAKGEPTILDGDWE